jgi:hypothetical protein
MIIDLKRLLSCSLAICSSSLEKSLLKHVDRFSIRFVVVVEW